MEANEISKKEENNVLETFEEKENEFMRKIPWYCVGMIVAVIVVIFAGIAIFFGGFDEVLSLVLGGVLGGAFAGVWIGYHVIGGVIGGVLYRKYLKLQASNKNIRAYSTVYMIVSVVSMIGTLIGFFFVRTIYSNSNFFPILLTVLVLLLAVLGVVLGGMLGGVLGGVLGGMLGVGAILFGMFFEGDYFTILRLILVLLVGIVVLGVVLILIRARTLGYKGLIGHTNMSTSIRMGAQLGTMLIFIPVMYFVMWVAFLSQQ